LGSLRIGIDWLGTPTFRIEACGGSVDGRLVRGNSRDGATTRDLTIQLTDVDPSGCLELGGPSIEGRFAGQITLVDVAHGNPREALGKLARSGSVTLEGRDGVLSGYLPASRVVKPSGKRREPQPIGRWEFSHLSVDAEMKTDRITVTRGEAEAEGVAWATKEASVVLGGPQPPRLQAELMAKPLEDSARAKAIIGLLPKAADKDGWRHYRASGPLSSIQLGGIK
jgi:hypothetical protein